MLEPKRILLLFVLYIRRCLLACSGRRAGASVISDARQILFASHFLTDSGQLQEKKKKKKTARTSDHIFFQIKCAQVEPTSKRFSHRMLTSSEVLKPFMQSHAGEASMSTAPSLSSVLMVALRERVNWATAERAGTRARREKHSRPPTPPSGSAPHEEESPGFTAAAARTTMQPGVFAKKCEGRASRMRAT